MRRGLCRADRQTARRQPVAPNQLGGRDPGPAPLGVPGSARCCALGSSAVTALLAHARANPVWSIVGVAPGHQHQPAAAVGREPRSPRRLSARRGQEAVGAASCAFDECLVTAPAHRCPRFARRLRTKYGPMRFSGLDRSRLPPALRSFATRSRIGRRPRKADQSWSPDHLLAKLDRPGSSPWETVICAGHSGRGIVRGCPLGTGQDRCEWHASGTAGEIDPVQHGVSVLPYS
jgi:hypothetical protein